MQVAPEGTVIICTVLLPVMVTVWPEEFSTLRAKWMPLPAWDQRK